MPNFVLFLYVCSPIMFYINLEAIVFCIKLRDEEQNIKEVCSAFKTISHNHLRTTAIAPVTLRHKTNKFHVPVVLQVALPFKTGMQ